MEKIYQLKRDGKPFSALIYETLIAAKNGMQWQWDYWKKKENDGTLEMTVSQLIEQQYFCIRFSDHTIVYSIGAIELLE